MECAAIVPLTVWCWRYFHLGGLQNAWHRPPVQWEVLAVEGQVLPTGAWQHPAHTNAKQPCLIYLLSH